MAYFQRRALGKHERSYRSNTSAQHHTIIISPQRCCGYNLQYIFTYMTAIRVFLLQCFGSGKKPPAGDQISAHDTDGFMMMCYKV